MKTTRCPLGKGCGGTGWAWGYGNDGPNPEPPDWVACECNPDAAGQPDALLTYELDGDGQWMGVARVWEMIDMGAEDAPF